MCTLGVLKTCFYNVRYVETCLLYASADVVGFKKMNAAYNNNLLSVVEILQN